MQVVPSQLAPVVRLRQGASLLARAFLLLRKRRPNLRIYDSEGAESAVGISRPQDDAVTACEQSHTDRAAKPA